MGAGVGVVTKYAGPSVVGTGVGAGGNCSNDPSRPKAFFELLADVTLLIEIQLLVYGPFVLVYEHRLIRGICIRLLGC